MPNSAVRSSTDDPVLAAEGLTKHFPVRHAGLRKLAVHAVDAVDLELHAGRVVALVGESGSGKSTVARLLAQLYPATSGRVLLHGQPVKAKFGKRFRAYCRRVQLIFQDPFASLNPVHTVGYTLRRSLRIHHQGVKGTELHRRLCALLEQVHLNPPERFIDKFPHELSGGQRQRISIARALAAKPEVLLADEPVSMLDVSIRLGVLNLLAELKEELDLAVLYITHDIASARYFAERTVVMYAGRVVERGDSEEVTQRPAHPYTKLLIASAPDPDALAGGEAPPARGDVPSLVTPPAGCRFHPRCPKAMERCRTEVPGFFPIGDGHEAACWLFAEDGTGDGEDAS